MAIHNTACAGECTYKKFKLEYQITSLELIIGKSLKIEAVCLNPSNSFDKEVIFKYSTNNFSSGDSRLDVAFLMIDDVIKNLELDKEKLRKLVIKDHQAFYVCKV